MKNKTAPIHRFVANRRYLMLVILFAIPALACSIFDDELTDAERYLTQVAISTQPTLVPSLVVQITSTPVNSVTLAPSHSPAPSPSPTTTPLADPGKTPTPTQTRGLTITVTKATPYANNTRVMIEVFVKNTGSESVTILENQLVVADSNGKLGNTQMHIATMVGNTERSQRATSFTVPPNSTVKIFLLAPTTCRPNLVVQYMPTAETYAACL